MTTKLQTVGKTPFSTLLESDPKFIDLYARQDQDSEAVVTIITIDKLLYEEWSEAQSDYFDKEEFKIENVAKPGIYRDDEIYEDGSENCYTVVVNYNFLTEQMIFEKIEELNEERDKNFEIKFEKNETVELE